MDRYSGTEKEGHSNLSKKDALQRNCLSNMPNENWKEASNLKGQSRDGSFAADANFVFAFTRRHVPKTDHVGFAYGLRYR